METLEIVKKSDLNFKKEIKVMKTGRATSTTDGRLIHFNEHNVESAKLHLNPHASKYYKFKMSYVVKDTDEQFFERGDSGSGVFVVEEDLSEKPLGIAFAYSFKYPYTYVCNIEEILQKLDLTLVRYRQDPWDWSPKD